MLSYGIVYAFQKYGSFGVMGRKAMLREIAYYAVAVVGLSATVNFGLVTVLKDYDSTLDKYMRFAGSESSLYSRMSSGSIRSGERERASR